MKTKSSFLIIPILICVFATFISCSSKKEDANNLGSININSPVSVNFSEFSGTDYYTIEVDEPVTFSVNLQIRTGKTSISLVDESNKTLLSINSTEKKDINLSPNKKTTYHVYLNYDNGVGTYSMSLSN